MAENTKPMSFLQIGDETFEVIDEQAREDIDSLKQMVKVVSKGKTYITDIQPNTLYGFDIDVSEEGYTCIGVVGYSLTIIKVGSDINFSIPKIKLKNDTKVSMDFTPLINDTISGVTVNGTVDALYIKNFS